MVELYKKEEKKKERETDASCTFLSFYQYFAEKCHFFVRQAHQIHEDKSEIVDKEEINGKKKRGENDEE